MYDVCGTRDKSNAQIEVDSDFLAQRLSAGDSRFTEMWKEYTDDMKKKDNFPASPEPFNTHNRQLLTALYCKDPQDVSIKTKPQDMGPGKPLEFTIDVWKSNTNQIYEEAKGHKITPDLIAGANKALNENIPENDRDLAVGQFNHRARQEHEPMEIVQDAKTGKLKFQAKNVAENASK